MTKNIEKLLRSVKHTKLTRESKDALRHSVIDFMKEHPVRTTEYTRLPERGRSFVFSQFISINTLQNMTLAIIVALIIGGSTSYAAEGAVPGDFLYPVKVEVNENLRSALALSTGAQAQWDTRVAERRVEEAIVLLSRGDVDDEDDEKLQELFEEHASKAENLIVEIETEGNIEKAIEARTEFEARLRSKQAVLQNLSEVRSEVRAEIDDLLSSLRTRLDNNVALRSKVRIEMEDEDSSVDTDDDTIKVRFESAVEGKEKSFKNKEEEVISYIEKKKEEVSEETYNEARVKVEAAKQIRDSAEEASEEGNYEESFKLYVEAHGLLQEAKLFIKTSARLAKDEKKQQEKEDRERDDDGEKEDDEKGDRDDRNDDKEGRDIEIEADVYTDITRVEVEIDDNIKETFETSARTETEIIAEIQAKYGFTEAQIKSGLDIDIEDKSSDEEHNDTDEEDERDNDNDEEEEDEDDDKDDRNRVRVRIDL